MFARRANPAVDPPIVRKSLSYLEAQVCDHLADWVDPSDKSKGILAREILPRGEPAFPPTPEAMKALASIEIPGCIFEDPVKDGGKLAERSGLLVRARAWARAVTIETRPEAACE